MKRTLYQEIAHAVIARANCQSTNSEWYDKWSLLLERIEKRLLPSGSGIDNGTKIDLDASSGRKIVMTFGYHHMNENGFYDGWTSHKAIITPSFDGIDIRITGPNRNDVKEYLYQTFEYDLKHEIEINPKGYFYAWGDTFNELLTAEELNAL